MTLSFHKTVAEISFSLALVRLILTRRLLLKLTLVAFLIWWLNSLQHWAT